MRLAGPTILILVAATIGGCGSDASEEGAGTAPVPRSDGAPAGAAASTCPDPAASTTSLRATGIECAEAGAVAEAWREAPACASAAARSSCEIRGYRCLAVAADRGVAVSCARPGRSLSFLAKPG
jgi:hypothetical protein